MLTRTRIALSTVLVLGFVGAALAGIQHARIAFIHECWSNGKPLAQCNCTFNALSELPENYRDHAIAWAHHSGLRYWMADGPFLIGKEAWRIVREKVTKASDFTDTNTMLRSGVRWIIQAIALEALKEVAPNVEPTAAVMVVVLPAAWNAVEERAAAERVYVRHCGTSKSFVVWLSDIGKGSAKLLDKSAPRTIDAAVPGRS